MAAAACRLATPHAAGALGRRDGLRPRAATATAAAHARPARAERGRVRHRHAEEAQARLAQLAVVTTEQLRPGDRLLHRCLMRVHTPPQSAKLIYKTKLTKPHAKTQ